MSDTAAKTKRSTKEAMGPYGRVGTIVNELDDRLGVAKGGRVFLDKIFPDHWSFMLGEISLYSFIVLIATGIFLALYYIPSTTEIIYRSHDYAPLLGQRVSEAYASTVHISFGVRGGLLVRQMHHWAADIFTGSIIVHMARIFFTGAFRKPRELNYTIGIIMLIIAIFEGYIGYSLPDDLISGTGLRIGYSIAESIPLVGSYLASFVWGGTFPGNSVLPRFYIIHVLIFPLILFALIGAHLTLLVRQKHTQFKGEGRTETNVVGSPMFPTFMAKTTGFLFMVAAASALLGAFAQINPIWQFGSYEPYKISYAVQPDWYMGWTDGALRIMPAWEFTAFGHTIPLEVFLPAVIFPGLVFNIALMWPALERRMTGDNSLHNLLDRPRDRPKRTAAGAAFFALLFTLFAASSTDVLANYFHLSLNFVLWSFRILTVAVPIIVAFVTYRICLEMQGVQGVGKRKRAVIVHRSVEGAYSTVTADPRPDDLHSELHPQPVPERIDIEPLVNGASAELQQSSPTGARQVSR
jgi:quinol---cytochrome-c reductase cytochrome b subunit